MDAIESLDWGAYAHFRFQVSQHPALVPFMLVAYYLSDYVSIGFLFSLVATLFLLQGRHRSAQATAASLAISLALIFGIQHLVPRMRPPDAQNWLGAWELVGTYPAGGVFLFMLGMILLGFATWDLLPRVWLRAVYLILATALVVWVCMSQFILATHFVTDVIGAIAGAALVAWATSKFLGERGRIIAP